MRAKMRVLILVGLAVILAAPAITVAAAPADADRSLEWSEVVSFDRVQQLLQAWFGHGGEDADAGPAAIDEVPDLGPVSVRAAEEGDDDGNGGPGWNPNG